MIGVRFPLFSKIMTWFFLNLVVVAAAGGALYYLRMENRSRQLFAGPIEGVIRGIEADINSAPKPQRDEILVAQSQKYGVEFYLFDDSAAQLGGSGVALPQAVIDELTKPERPFGNRLPPFEMKPPPDGAPRPRMIPPPDRPPDGSPPPSVYLTTNTETPYWYVGRIMLFDQSLQVPIRARVVVGSTSFTGHGLFLNFTPFALLGIGIFGFSLVFWFPFVRRMTGALGQMTKATREIADERFDVRVDESRTDEIGELGAGINQMAERLDGFVRGQKRFLGDISHELNSPLARMQVALSILEERAETTEQSHIKDVQEEVELMARLVNELLTYSRSAIQGGEIHLAPVNLRATVERVLEVELSSGSPAITTNIDYSLNVMGRPELLKRAIANVIRNSVRYAGDGKIEIVAGSDDGHVTLAVRDEGPGVPAEMLEKIFDPLFRVQDHRSRDTGGNGLGLAIVKTCIEACSGKVSARNRHPHGLEIVFILPLTSSA